MTASSMTRMSSSYAYETGSNIGGTSNVTSISGNAVIWIIIAAIALIGGLVLHLGDAKEVRIMK